MGDYVEEFRAHLPVIADIVSNIALLLQMPIVIVPISFDSHDSDMLSGKELAQAIFFRDVVVIEHADLNACLVKGVLGEAFGAIGVSYHFCTFALTQGVPAVCLYDGDYYGQKGRGLCGFWADNRLALSLRDLTTLSAVKHIMQVFNDDRLRENLPRIAVEAVERWHSIFDQQVIKAFMSHDKTECVPEVNETVNHASAGQA
jgi:polysaccharide pyruvyl transferase WcaK-like protein